MKITIEPTGEFQRINGEPARVWRGFDDRGEPVVAHVRCVSPQTRKGRAGSTPRHRHAQHHVTTAPDPALDAICAAGPPATKLSGIFLVEFSPPLADGVRVRFGREPPAYDDFVQADCPNNFHHVRQRLTSHDQWARSVRGVVEAVRRAIARKPK